MKYSLIALLALCGAASGTAGAVGTMAEVTIHDRVENRALSVYQYQGRYYVVGKPGNEYLVRVRNRTGGDILSVVSVDGVNAVSGESASWNQTGYVLAPNQSFDIKGWRKSLQRVAAFFFTEHQSSYAARTGRPENVGVIGVAVFRKKPEPRVFLPRERHEGPRAQSSEPRGPDTAADSASRLAESDAVPRSAPFAPEKANSLGTGHGRSEASRVTYTDFERATPGPEEVITIYYDSYANLMAMGVIKGPRISAPTPFPGQFVSDPQ